MSSVGIIVSSTPAPLARARPTAIGTCGRQCRQHRHDSRQAVQAASTGTQAGTTYWANIRGADLQAMSRARTTAEQPVKGRAVLLHPGWPESTPHQHNDRQDDQQGPESAAVLWHDRLQLVRAPLSHLVNLHGGRERTAQCCSVAQKRQRFSGAEKAPVPSLPPSLSHESGGLRDAGRRWQVRCGCSLCSHVLHTCVTSGTRQSHNQDQAGQATQFCSSGQNHQLLGLPRASNTTVCHNPQQTKQHCVLA